MPYYLSIRAPLQISGIFKFVILLIRCFSSEIERRKCTKKIISRPPFHSNLYSILHNPYKWKKGCNSPENFPAAPEAPSSYFPVPVKRFLIFFLLSSFNKHILDTFSLYNKCQIVEEHINYLPPHKVDATKGPPLRCTTLYSHSF